jgi:hypothetical protein
MSIWDGAAWHEDVGGGGSGVVEAIVAGTGITVDDTDPANPVVAATAIVESVVAGTGVTVDNTDPANPVVAATGGGGFTTANLLHVREEQSSGTNAGSSSAGSNIRVLNTTVVNNIASASLSSNQITLPAGTYWVELTAPAFSPDRARVGLYNVTDSVLVFAGQVYYSTGSNAMTVAKAQGYLTVVGTKVFEVRHYLQSSFGTYGLGLGYSAPGINEIFAEAFIWKI